MLIRPDDPRHPVADAIQRRLHHECPNCGHALWPATHRKTKKRALVCLHCDYERELNEK